MPPLSPLLALPAEIRTQIWRYLLCPPHGTVHLHNDLDWYDKIENFEDEEDSDEDKDEDEDDVEYEQLLCDGRAIHSKPALPVSILRVNHQLHDECSPLIYSNKLHFGVTPTLARIFFTLRPARDRRHIRHLGFGSASTSADDADVQCGWSGLHNYIAKKLNIETVTIQVPGLGRAWEWEWYFWPAVEGLVRILLDGNIESTRLLFAASHALGDDGYEPITLPEDEVLEDLRAVDQALHREMKTEERNAMWKYTSEHAVLSWDTEAYLEFLKGEKKKRRLPLKVEREDGARGDEGTVVVLRNGGVNT